MTNAERKTWEWLLSLPAWQQRHEAHNDPKGFIRLAEAVGEGHGLDTEAVAIAQQRCGQVDRARRAGWGALLSL